MLYTAPGCHLCERARAELEPLAAELGFGIVEVDISGNAELERAHRAFIPVLELDGELLSVYRLDEQALRRRLASGSSQTGP